MAYFVYEEHTILYEVEGSIFHGILVTSVLRGSAFDPRLDGTTIPSPLGAMRPATREDFAAFRVDPRGYFPD